MPGACCWSITTRTPAARSAETLEPLGCLVGEAEGGEEALAILRSEPCDLALIHQTLPDLPGHEVCRRLRERPPGRTSRSSLPAIQGDPTDLTAALALGADDLVAYPLDLRQLAAKLQYLLRLRDAQDRIDQLARNLLMANRQLEDSLQARSSDVRQAHDALVVCDGQDGRVA